MNALVSGTQNWSAYLDLRFQAGAQKTSLVPKRRYGPLSVQRPFYPEQDVCHTYLLHPPGGVVGGDRLDLKIRNEAGSHSLVTTPGATKFYLSAGQTAQVEQHLAIDQSAALEFLPQENIYFPGARVQMHTRLDLANDARVLYWEKHCFGRPANGESFDQGFVRLTLELFNENQLLFTETQRIDYREIQRSSGLRDNPVMGSLLVAGEAISEDTLRACREISHDKGISGITRIDESLLLLRYMSDSTLDMNLYFNRLWEWLRPCVLQRDACFPRIWNT